MSFKDQVIIVTGAGAGLGKDYALYFAREGAKVLVNDLGSTGNRKSADVVVEEITKNGGVAIANYDSVELGEKIVKQAVDKFGRVDVLINNAGIIRDKAFKNLDQADWDIIVKVHLNAMFACSKAVWPLMIAQKYGRIINVSSPSGLYGSFGQANYAMAKAGIVGFTKTLAKEGDKYNIKTNCIAPIAATQMTENIMSKELLAMMKVEYITPLVAYLSHKDCEEQGSIYEVAGSFVAKVRYQRSEGVFFGPSINLNSIKEKIGKINCFGGKNTYYDNDETSLSIVAENFEKFKTNKTSGSLKSDEIFGLIGQYLGAGLGKDTVSKIDAVFQFDITEKKGGPVVKSWTIDLKTGSGHSKEGKPEKADATFTMTDADFVALTSGSLNPQMAFVQGKMKIKGNMKKATAFTPDLFPKPTPENIEKYKSGKF